VDGLQSLDVGAFATAYDRNMQLCEQVRQFKKMALQMKVPVILTSPLGREVETRPNKRPVMRDLRDIGMLEDIADIILFIYRDEMYNPDSADRGMAEIILGKHRNGLPCMVQLAFRGEYCLFENFRSGNVSYAR
jgi:replicative DNA helicase